MFTRWGDLVYRFRFAVIVVVGGAMLALGAYGMGLGPRLSQSGWFDPGSESVVGAQLADGSYGRDHLSDVIVMYNAPEGKTIDDPEFSQKVVGSLTTVMAEHPQQLAKINGTYWKVGDAASAPSIFGSKDKKHAFASLAIAGDNDTVMMDNYRALQGVFDIPGVDVEVSGLQPLAVTLTDTLAHDSKRMEVLAFPAVAVLLFFIFGGIVAAALPLIIGGLTILGATGIVMALTNFTEVNFFVTGVVSMIGLGLAIDYGLFIVSRFREELAEGYDTRAAVRRSVMTAGRTVVFSATMIIASVGGILIFPQAFLRSVAYGTIAAVSLAALTAITILPAMLAILGPRVDSLGLKRFRKTKTAEQVENGFWGNLTRWVMRHPLKIAIPIVIGLLLLIIPVKDLTFGGINEKYLPPDNETRSALEHFYEVFPQKKTDPIQLVFVSSDTNAIGKVWKEANQAPGLVSPFEVPGRSPTNPEVFRTSATLVDPTNNAEPTIDYLRSIEVPDGVTMYVTGQPALMADSIDTLMELMPWMILLVLATTTILMFLTFGSLVLPIKAALMSALGLGSTLGILTWIFVDGHGAELLNFTPQPISAPVLMLIIAIIYGLSTDYEVFLLSRMVEARAQGASTTEAVRIGTAQTGRIITAAALILLVVTGAFAFSDMVMMQYIAYGMIAALVIDATVLRMLLVPAIMKLLGDDCWWAPKWMKRIQEKIGLGEPILDDERPGNSSAVDLVKTTPITDPPTMQMTAVPDSKLARTPRRPRTVAEIEADAPTQRMDKVVDADSAEPTRPRLPKSPDPTRPRASMLSSGEPTRELPVVKPGTKPDDAPAKDAGLDLPKYDSGEATQILPIVKADAVNPTAGQADSHGGHRGDSPADTFGGSHGDSSADTFGGPGRDSSADTFGGPRRDPSAETFGGSGSDSTSDSSTDNDRGYSGPSFGTPPDLGDPETGPGGATRPTNSVGHSSAGFSNGSPLDDTRFGSSRDSSDGATPNSHGYTDFGTAGNASGVTGPSFGTDLGNSDNTPRVSGPSFGTDAGFGNSSGVTGPSFGTSGDAPRTSGASFGTPADTAPSAGFEAPSISRPAPAADGGSGLDLSTGIPGVTPRGSERVQPPSGYTPGVIGETPQVSTPHESGDDAGFRAPATDLPQRPSIVPPARPSSATPPHGTVTPPAPSIVNQQPSRLTPPQPVDPPADDDTPPSGTFTGFNPVTASNFRPIAPASTPEPTTPADSHTTSRDVFGTSVPVEPQQPPAPWNNGMTGPGTPRGYTTPEPDGGARFASTTENGHARPSDDHPVDIASAPNPAVPQSNSPRATEVARPQVAPTGFTAVTPNDSTDSDDTAAQASTRIPASRHSSDRDEPFTADQDATETPGQWQAPSGFTAVPSRTASPSEPTAAPSQAPETPAESATASTESSSPAPESGEPAADTRNEIENWMAQLRSSRRGTPADEGRHHGGEGRTVSVNELLRRREDNTE
ncbi:MMPL family transporter [Nocardia sp. NPDC058666]|uniref:MMPL family transporter n=1 Tax=Nocardia sp. NPDC058666 TaxID=3346587 RepID=UPI0036567EF2